MLDVTADHKPTAPTLIADQSAQFTKEAARADLAEIDGAGTRPSLRALAERWKWGKGTVERFLSQIDGAKVGTVAGQPDAPSPEQVRDMLTAAGEDFDRQHPPRTIAQSVERVLAEPPAVDDADDFQWDDDSVVLHDQPATAIYFNKFGGLVIRQEARWPSDEDDPYVVIAPNNVAAFIDKITDVVGIPSVGGPS